MDRVETPDEADKPAAFPTSRGPTKLSSCEDGSITSCCEPRPAWLLLPRAAAATLDMNDMDRWKGEIKEGTMMSKQKANRPDKRSS